MKFPGGNPLLFCEQVGTVTSFFEQWNDCERTVVLYALLKRVPFANLKFLQLSIDYNLAQNYSSQSKLQLLETHANNANYLNKLVQRYQICCGGAEETSSSTSALNKNINNNNSSIANNNLTISDSGYESEKKNSTFDLSSTSSLSCTSSTSALSSCTSSSASQPAVNSSSSSTSSSSSSSSSSSTVNPAKTSAAAVNVAATAAVTDLHIVSQKKKINQQSDKVTISRKLSPSPGPPSLSSETETKKDILNDMLTYLPLLKPGNDDVKSVYMSLIPAAVEDACQQAVPTELVQHILSYLLIHPAVNNDDRRSLSYWLRHLEEHIATSYVSTTGPSTTLTNASSNSNNLHHHHSSSNKLMNNNNNSYFVAQPGGPHHPQQQQQQMLGGGSGPPNNNSSTSGKGGGSQQSLHYLATGPWPPLGQSQQQQHVPHNLLQQTATHHQPPLQSTSSSSSSLLSKSQQSLNHASNNASSSSSSSCLDSASSQLMKTVKNSTMLSGVGNLDWSTASSKETISVCEDGGGGGGTVPGMNGVHVVGSLENVSIKEYVPVSFNYHPVTASTSQNHGKHHNLIAPSSQTQGLLSSTSGHSSGSNLNLNGGGTSGHPVVLSTSGADLDSSDDNHLSFSKNGTEIFDYDCDFDNEEEFKYLARAAAAAVAAVAGSTTSSANVSSISGKVAAGSAVNSAANSTHNSSCVSKNRVSFDANISDYLRVPPIGVGDFDLDSSGLMKTRRSNSLTTTVGNACGLSMGELHQQQKQNNECLSAENLSNLQLLQNKPRSFSLTMESPRSSLTSSGSETRLDDFKQHQMIKMYGQSNTGMSSIAHWLKSLRLHKYVWLFTNLTYEQMLEMNEEYLASLGVTKGARHKLVLCIQKLNERYGVLARLEKELLASGGSKGHLAVVFEELTNIVLTPMKPVGRGDNNDIAGHFMKVLDLISSILLVRSLPGGFSQQQEEEYLNAFTWLLDRALHNDAFSAHSLQIKEYKYKANKLKINYTPKSHYSKNSSMNGSINKARWPTTNKHKPNSSDGNIQKTPHRKSSLQYFTSPLQPQSQQQQSPQQQQQQQQQQLHQQPSSSGLSSSTGSGGSHSHLHTIPPPSHAYGYGGGHNPNAGTGHNNSYNKSSSYPNFASGGSAGAVNVNGSIVKHHPQHPQPLGQQGPPPPPPHLQTPQQHQQQVHLAHQQQQQQSVHVPPGAFMYHRHSLNNISAHQHQQQFLQHLQNQQQQQLPSIFLTPMGGPTVPPPNGGGSGNASQGKSPQPLDHPVASAGPSAPGGVVDLHSSGPVAATVGNDGNLVEGLNSSTGSTGNNSSSKSQNSSIGDINSRLEFLCLQMTEQAIN